MKGAVCFLFLFFLTSCEEIYDCSVRVHLEAKTAGTVEKVAIFPGNYTILTITQYPKLNDTYFKSDAYIESVEFRYSENTSWQHIYFYPNGTVDLQGNSKLANISTEYVQWVCQ